MKKRLLNFDKISYERELKFADKDLSLFNNVLAVVKTSVSDLKIDETSFSQLLKSPKEYGFDILVGSNPLTIGGITVSKEKAMDFVEMPSNWLAVIKIVNEFKRDRNDNPSHIKDHPQWSRETNPTRLELSDIELVKGQFVLKKSFIERTENQFSVYTQNDKQNQVHDTLTSIYDGLCKLKEVAPQHFNFRGESFGLEDLGFTIGGDGTINQDIISIIKRVH
ncbi:hypothetical protein [Mucilaginibacter sp.]|uniref:hypothetical protein n=1 Tax=Mucilaginibacter sp. TaxID=1882438 RepID=UPI0025E783AB|nr:hypothetical protein [Mucilaginibacter sp.]